MSEAEEGHAKKKVKTLKKIKRGGEEAPRTAEHPGHEVSAEAQVTDGETPDGEEKHEDEAGTGGVERSIGNPFNFGTPFGFGDGGEDDPEA